VRRHRAGSSSSTSNHLWRPSINGEAGSQLLSSAPRCIIRLGNPRRHTRGLGRRKAIENRCELRRTSSSCLGSALLQVRPPRATRAQAACDTAGHPWITAKDLSGGVDCHLNYGAEDGLALQHLLKQDREGGSPACKEVAGSAPPGLTLRANTRSSRHAQNIPAACLRATAAPQVAPPFSTMLHTIHLTGGDNFLTLLGQCTHCHKLNATAGTVAA
jgi:hypothetical protein